MGIFKSNTDLRLLREAAQLAGHICDALLEMAQVGISTIEIEAQANKQLQMNRSLAPFKQFEGFGHAVCISLNDEVVNGPPSRERVVSDGDVVSIAIGTCVRGIHGKAARTSYVGNIADASDIERLICGTRDSIRAVLEYSQPNMALSQLIACIQQTADRYKLTIIKGTGGCGIGKQLHEWPAIPNRLEDLSEDMSIPVGSAFVLMPMMSLGKNAAWELHSDGWTQVTQDHALSAHFAETCLMTETGLVAISQIL